MAKWTIGSVASAAAATLEKVQGRFLQSRQHALSRDVIAQRIDHFVAQHNAQQPISVHESQQRIGQMTLAVYDADHPTLLDAACRDFVNIWGHEDGQVGDLDHIRLASLGENLAQTIHHDLERWWCLLEPRDKENVNRLVKKIGQNNNQAKELKAEYIANRCLFIIIRDHFKLDKKQFMSHYDVGGFIFLTYNGSMVSSPPLEAAGQSRTLYYVKMPSRIDSGAQTRDYTNVRLRSDIEVDKECRHSAMKRMSPVRFLIYVPPQKAHIFDRVRETAEQSSMVIYNTLYGA